MKIFKAQGNYVTAEGKCLKPRYQVRTYKIAKYLDFVKNL